MEIYRSTAASGQSDLQSGGGRHIIMVSEIAGGPAGQVVEIVGQTVDTVATDTIATLRPGDVRLVDLPPIWRALVRGNAGAAEIVVSAERLVQVAVGPSQAAFEVTIADGAQVSGAVDLGDRRPVALILPASYDGTALGLQIAAEAGGTYLDLYDETGTIVAYTVAASRAVRLPPTETFACRHLKLKAGTAQTGATVVTILAQ